MRGFLILSALVIRCHRVVTVGFDATAQYVNTTGEHAFVPPGPNDLRGMCPGLNALANHNYLPHNGVATIQQFVDACSKVFGMGVDLALFLGAYAAIADGDGRKCSINGTTPLVSLPPPASQPKGLSLSHNNYESDYSPTRPDIFLAGQAYLLDIIQYLALRGGRKSYDLDYLTEFRAFRYNQSLFENPHFFSGPFSGVLVNPASYTFVYRFMANKSSEHPEGFLGPQVLDSFYSVKQDENGGFIYKHGHERIPDNWYRRAFGDEYTIPFFLADVAAAAKKHPEFLSIGGNTGKVNSFAGVDLRDLTGGVYNAKNLLESNNLYCFLFQVIQLNFNSAEAAQIRAFDLISDLVRRVGGLPSLLGCPELTQLDPIAREKLFNQFPGFTDFPQ